MCLKIRNPQTLLALFFCSVTLIICLRKFTSKNATMQAILLGTVTHTQKMMEMLPYRKNKQTLLIEDCADLIRDFKYQFQFQTKQDETKGHTRRWGFICMATLCRIYQH